MCIVPVISTLNKASSVLMFFSSFLETQETFSFKRSFHFCSIHSIQVFLCSLLWHLPEDIFFFFSGILACNHANMIKQDSKHAKSYSCYKCWWHEYGTTRIYTTLWSSCTNMSLDGTWDACTIYGPPVLAGTYFWKTKIVMMASLFYTMYAQWTGTR